MTVDNWGVRTHATICQYSWLGDGYDSLKSLSNSDAMYSMQAALSQTVTDVPSGLTWTMAGRRPFGLIWVYQSDFCSPPTLSILM
jgi:hypothetical protein